MLLLYLYFTTTRQHPHNKYKIYSVVTITCLLFFTPIVSQETISKIITHYYESTIQLKIIYLGLLFSFLFLMSKHYEKEYKNIIIPFILLSLIIIAPDMSTGLSNNVFDTLTMMIDNISFGKITISHIMFILGVYVIFHAWCWYSEYFTPFGWYMILMALANAELSKNIIYQF
jgi:hypothetical protein